MKIATRCVLLALIVTMGAFLLGAAEAPSPEAMDQPQARYMGNSSCRECHPTAYEQWVGTKHSRAYVILAWDKARMMVTKGHSVLTNATCLRCHSTAATLPMNRRAEGFHVEEGVQCEGCHGPGEYHVAMQRAMKVGEENAPDGDIASDEEQEADQIGELPERDEESCVRCHRPLASHAMLRTPVFDYEVAWPLVKHGKEPKE